MRSLVQITVDDASQEVIDQCIATEPGKRPSSIMLFETTRRYTQNETFTGILLHQAARNGHLPVVNRLMEVGVDSKAE
jgi:hypothetical protein